MNAKCLLPPMPPNAPSSEEGFRVLTAANSSPHTLAGTNTYLVGRARVLVIDPGPDDPAHAAQVLDRIAGGGGQVALILVTHTHGDHVGGARRLSEGGRAPVAWWRGGDRPLDDGQTIVESGARLRVLHTPGHAPDHVVFYWEGPRVLFSGDLVLGSGTVSVSPPGGSMADYLRSLSRIAGLDLAVIAPGHGPLVTDPAARVAEYIAHRQMRERQVLAAVAAGPRTPGEIAAAIYPDLDPRLHPAAEGTVLAHLLKLVHDGRILREGNRYYAP